MRVGVSLSLLVGANCTGNLSSRFCWSHAVVLSARENGI